MSQELVIAQETQISASQLIEDYLAGQLTEGTRRIYGSDIRQIFGDKIPSWEEVCALSPEDIVQWRNSVWNNGAGLAASTINRKLVALKTFYDHLIARRMIDYNPCDPKLVRRIKDKKSSTARMGITREELSALLAACDIGKNKVANVRDRAIISLMYSCLLRRSEVSAFKWGDLDRDGGRSIVRLPLTKGGANDYVVIEPQMLKVLDKYYNAMGGAPTWMAFVGKPIEQCPVFIALDPVHRGSALSGQSLNAIVQKRADLAGLQPISAHIMRHTGITHLLAAGHPVTQVQILARHSDPKQTMAYAELLQRMKNDAGKTLAMNLGGI